MSTGEIVLLIVVAALAALLKSITGMGYPLVLVPVLALVIDISDAIMIVAPSNLVLNAQLSWKTRHRRREARTLREFLIGGALGAVLGSLLLTVLPEQVLRAMLIAVVVAFLVNRIRRREHPLGSAPMGEAPATDRFAPAVGFVGGVFQGAAGISGPVVTPWFLSRRIGVDPFLFAITFTFALTGAVQIAVLIIDGALTARLLGLGLTLIPIAFVVFPLGGIIRDRIAPVIFERAVLAMLALSAVSLAARMF